MAYETLIVETRSRVGLITLNRPQALNALNTTVMADMVAALKVFQQDAAIGAIVLTGSEKAFAAGADIKQMQSMDYIDAFMTDFFGGWEEMTRVRKPIIAAENAKFGQPEITLGVMPGMGGSQRLTRFVGKSKAMDMCLTGRMMDAAEAERCGLVSRVVPVADLMEEALKAAAKIASFSLPAVMMVKDAVNRSYETTLAEGLLYERRMFHSLFAFDDQTEGMTAFVEKRSPNFRHR